MRRIAMIIVGCSIGVMAVGGPVWAQDPIHKAGRGLVNVLTSWIELPKQIHLGTLEPNPLVGLGRGVLKGVSLTVLRIGVGLYEAVTFPIPYPKRFASPYESMAVTDYSWE